MATPGDRFKQWIDDFAMSIKDRLRGWAGDVIGFGIEVFMDVLAKSFAFKTSKLWDTLSTLPGLPEELKELLTEAKTPTGESAAAIQGLAVRSFIGGAIGRLEDSLFARFSYDVASRFHPKILEIEGIIEAMKRRIILPDVGRKMLLKHGLEPETIEQMITLGEVRLPSDVVAPVWLRDKEKWEKWWDDVLQGGVTPERIEVLKEFAYRMPSPAEVITMMAHEAFEEDSIQRYGLDDEYDRLDVGWFDKAGVHPDARKLFWRSHWIHPSYSQITDMLHRGLKKPDGSEFTEEDVYEWYRVVEFPPFWRDMLTELSWDLPNRIEVRMMARYGLVGKDFLVDILKKVGLREDYREVTADMMLAMGVRTDVATRYSKGWINKEQVKSELAATGLSPEVTDRLYQWIVKNVSDERVAPERDLTVSDLVSAYKKGFLTFDETVERLMAMGYDEEEAILKIAIKVEIEAGSPENKAEAKRLTDLYCMAVGLPTDRSKEEIIQAEKAVAAAYPVKPALSADEVKTRVDTARRKRRRGETTRAEEITELLTIGLAVQLAQAYAENDDLRIRAGG